MSEEPKRRFKVELEALADPDGTPAEVRLRAALKRLLRSFRLRCVKVEEIHPEEASGERPENHT